MTVELALMQSAAQHQFRYIGELTDGIKQLQTERDQFTSDILRITAEREQLKLKLEEAMASHRKINAEKLKH